MIRIQAMMKIGMKCLYKIVADEFWKGGETKYRAHLVQNFGRKYG